MRRVTELMGINRQGHDPPGSLTKDEERTLFLHHPVTTLHNVISWKLVFSTISVHGHRQLVTEILTITKVYSHLTKEYSNVKISFDVKFAVYSLIFFSFCFRLI